MKDVKKGNVITFRRQGKDPEVRREEVVSVGSEAVVTKPIGPLSLPLTFVPGQSIFRVFP